MEIFDSRESLTVDQEESLRASMMLSVFANYCASFATSWDRIQTTDLALNMPRTGTLAYNTASRAFPMITKEVKVCFLLCTPTFSSILPQPRRFWAAIRRRGVWDEHFRVLFPAMSAKYLIFDY